MIDWRATRIALSEAQNHRCCYCGVETVLDTPGGAPARPLNIATVEHLTPRAYGGKDCWENLVMACLACNMARDTLTFWIFRELVKRWRRRGNGLPAENFTEFSHFVSTYLRERAERFEHEVRA